MFSMQQFPALPPEEERYRQVLSTDRVSGTDDDNMGDGCSQKLASAKYLRLLLLILIPCICALILLLVILLTFVGILEKTCFYSNGSDLLAAGGNTQTSDIPFPNIVENGSDVAPTVDLKMLPSSWTQSPLSHVDQMHENLSMFGQALQEDPLAPITPAPPLNPTTKDVGILTRASEDNMWSFASTEEKTLWSTDTSIKITDRISSLPTLSSIHPAAVQEMNLKKSACINITYSQCQILPYNHTTLTSVLSIVKSIEMEKFLKFFSYLNRLSCYQHIMLFGCSLALPECISDGDDSRGFLPCRSFCEAAKEGCEPVLRMVNSSWPEFLKCSQFQNRIENDTTTKVCFSPWQERGKQSAQNPPSCPSCRLAQIRKWKKKTRDEMFNELLQNSHTESAQQTEWRERLLQSRMEARATAEKQEQQWLEREQRMQECEERRQECEERRMDAFLRVMEDQSEMLQCLVKLQQDQGSPLQPLSNHLPPHPKSHSFPTQTRGENPGGCSGDLPTLPHKPAQAAAG